MRFRDNDCNIEDKNIYTGKDIITKNEFIEIDFYLVNVFDNYKLFGFTYDLIKIFAEDYTKAFSYKNFNQN